MTEQAAEMDMLKEIRIELADVNGDGAPHDDHDAGSAGPATVITYVGGNAAALRVSPSKDDTPHVQHRYCLRSFTLPRTVVRMGSTETDLSDDNERRTGTHHGDESSRSITIRSKVDIERLVSHYNVSPEGSPFGSEPQNVLASLSQCVEWGLAEAVLQADSSPTATCTTLNVHLTRRAFDVCHPRTLPVEGSGRRRRQSTSTAAGRMSGSRNNNGVACVLAVQGLIGALVPGFTSIWGDAKAVGSPSSVPPITARRVYKLVDNAQLEEALVRPGETTPPLVGTMKIPGLVPTLRGYQQYAVEWMLRRERALEVGDEWELAWMVLQTRPVSHTTAASVGTALRFLPNVASSERRDANSLYICPHFGWLATSYESARIMTLGPDTQSTEAPLSVDSQSSSQSDTLAVVKGGILAESMGLGKTVEVLACILANQRPKEQWQQPSSRNAQRKLSFEDCGDRTGSDAPKGADGGMSERVGVIRDMSEFGEVDSSDDDMSMVSAAGGDEKLRTRSPSTNVPIVVTPERHASEEKWVDDALIGSCICGRMIDLFHQKPPGPIVLCESCNEPMHKDCAGFVSREELLASTRPIRYRQRFTHLVTDCLVCESRFCPCCTAASGRRVPSRATLIITPAAILNQWGREISTHARTPAGEPLKTLVYLGLDATCKSSAVDKAQAMKLLHPRHLSDADIVLTTFDALMGDLGHSDENRFVPTSLCDDATSYLRKRKRYRAVPTPLLTIDWWRVCLDEAQRVETPTAASARMAVKLPAVHRWCVSGTPVWRGKLDDLFGLLLFLRVPPFTNKAWFNSCFNPSHPMVDDHICHLLRNVLWRSTKKHHVVKEQMGIPEQLERKIILQASSIERHFYERLLEKVLSTAGEMADREQTGKKRKSSQLDLLAENLHQLRAACCHPQVGTGGVSNSKRNRASHLSATSAVGSRVMTMEQILDKFIDDAKLKCEEAQRLTVMHMNAMAAIWRLKVEAKDRGVEVQEADTALLANSCRLYLESISMTEENATPTLAVGDAYLSGCKTFWSPAKDVRLGKSTAIWSPLEGDVDKPWVAIEFLGAARKVTQVRVRSIAQLPQRFLEQQSGNCGWRLMFPKDCVIQVASAALGGAFVDVARLRLPNCTDADDIAWVSEGGFRTNKSKSWRIVIQSFHNESNEEDRSPLVGVAGLDFELYEASIASDPLQRLHSLHNAARTFELLLHHDESDNITPWSNLKLSTREMTSKVDFLTKEATEIESLYTEVTRSTHSECMRRLEECSSIRKAKLKELIDANVEVKSNAPDDVWDDWWWDDFLALLLLNGSELHPNVLEKLHFDLDGVIQKRVDTDRDRDKIKFPEFASIDQFRTALILRMKQIRSGLGIDRQRRSRVTESASTDLSHADDPFIQARSTRFQCARQQHDKVMEAISKLSAQPATADVYENAHCHVCKSDWFQTGPMCKHCKLHDDLRDLSPDQVTLAILTSIYGVVRSHLGGSLLRELDSKMRIGKRAKLFFHVLEAEKREKAIAYRAWRVHLDLLNDLDELNQCKSSMRLTYEGEDVTQLTSDQLNAVVEPFDLNARFHVHASKQVMTQGELRRAKDTLRYLRNLDQASTGGSDPNALSQQEDRCSICLLALQSEKILAVLMCGHRFHDACLEKLQSRRSGSSISCPMRCPQVTPVDSWLLVSPSAPAGRAMDGGPPDSATATARPVKGSWGTKVSRLVRDVLDIRDASEKGVIFSQWEDMLNIVQEALSENGVEWVRPSGAKKIGDAVRRFRSDACTVLLLNVKNGGEGLTLLEATHVFMVEPLLNSGLDSQAINRITRIGQTKKTFVWRYLMEDTIEIKIDAMRSEHETDETLELEDEIRKSRTSALRAGGIDGGFQTHQELLDLLK